MRIVLLTLAALLLAACTPMQWVKSGGTEAERETALAECQQEAWREARLRFTTLYPMAPTVVQDSLGRRFIVYPSGPFADPFGEQFAEEGRLTNFCMRAKGWQLEEVAKK